MDIFTFDSYKDFVNEKVSKMPKRGFGQFRKIAQSLSISAVIVSQVFKGDRDLTLEQAFGVTEYFGLNTMERDYYLLLVQRDRAGHFKLKKVFTDQINLIRKESKEVSSRTKLKELSEQEKAVFYSDWLYLAISLGSNTNSLRTDEEISKHFNVPLKKVRSIIEFLLNYNLCVIENGKLKPTLDSVHLPRESPLINRHHNNWRMQSLKAMEQHREEDLFFSAPIVASFKTKEKIKAQCLKLIEEAGKEVSKAKEEELFCLNIDLFSF